MNKFMNSIGIKARKASSKKMLIIQNQKDKVLKDYANLITQ